MPLIYKQPLYFVVKANLGTLTFPTEEKNSSRSLLLILAANCMQNTVRASFSSGVSGIALSGFLGLSNNNDILGCSMVTC